ncbi:MULTISPECIES: Rrf2 family transcriptional regulator [unclassified Novosphingobium]|uniref:RrF2 family transcriptional regulator n=1 Tax=unclassified Novosphingobium TaxID=2644732 RepID=UPI0013578430|nr:MULTISPECIES: Rrf2 family transcriptional regulator [unclassified Novosphingobium]
MRLTAHTDYSLRILLHAALVAKEGPKLLSIAQVAYEQRISRNVAMKVVSMLAEVGLLETVRGRSGGFRLGRPAEEIGLGEIVRLTEPRRNAGDGNNCGLTAMLSRATNAFLAELDGLTLADAAASRLRALLI